MLIFLLGLSLTIESVLINPIGDIKGSGLKENVLLKENGNTFLKENTSLKENTLLKENSLQKTGASFLKEPPSALKPSHPKDSTPKKKESKKDEKENEENPKLMKNNKNSTENLLEKIKDVVKEYESFKDKLIEGKGD